MKGYLERELAISSGKTLIKINESPKETGEESEFLDSEFEDIFMDCEMI